MKTSHSSLGPIPCHGCQEFTPVSTKFGVPIACKCGVQHSAVEVIVASGEDLPKPPAELTEADVAKMSPAEILRRLHMGGSAAFAAGIK
jgi:hypothetical protein